MGERSELSTLLELVGRVNDAVGSAKGDVQAIRAALDVLRIELVNKISNTDVRVEEGRKQIEEYKTKYADLEKRLRDVETKTAQSNPTDTEKRVRELEAGQSAMTARLTVYAAIAGALVAVLTAIITRGLGLR